MAGRQLPGGGDDLSPGQPAATGTPEARAHQKPPARPLGLEPRSGLHLGPCQSGDPTPRSECHLPLGSRPWAPGVLGPTYLDGSYSEIYPDKSQDSEGLRRFFKQFSFPGHIGSHCTPETPGSIHEGGELGYVLSHACGAVFDNPDLIAIACVGDGEAETGPLATSWHINKFLNPLSDGVVLPVLHLNGYKIANPTLLARIPKTELSSLLRGYGWEPLFVEGSEPQAMHQAMAAAMDQVVRRLQEIRHRAQEEGGADQASRPIWPMIVLRSPKGWTGPEALNGKRIEGFWRSHQVPLPNPKQDPAQLQQLEA